MATEYEYLKPEAADILMEMELSADMQQRLLLARRLFRPEGPYYASKCDSAAPFGVSRSEQNLAACRAAVLLDGLQIAGSFKLHDTRFVPQKLDVASEVLTKYLALPTFVLREFFDDNPQHSWLMTPGLAKRSALLEAAQTFRLWPQQWYVDGLPNFQFLEDNFKQPRETPASFHHQRICAAMPCATIVFTEDSKRRSAVLRVGVATVVIVISEKTRVEYSTHQRRLEMRNLQIAIELPTLDDDITVDVGTYRSMAGVMRVPRAGFTANVCQRTGSLHITS